MMRGYGLNSGYTTGGGWSGWLPILFFGLLGLVGIVVLVLWALRSSSGHGHSASGGAPPIATGHDEAVAIARKRLASGEITKDEYDSIMRALSS